MKALIKLGTITATFLIFGSVIQSCFKPIKKDEADHIRTSDPYGIFFDSAEYPPNKDIKEDCYRLIKFKTKSNLIALLCIQEDATDWVISPGLPDKEYKILPGSARYTAFQIMKKYYGENKTDAGRTGSTKPKG